MRLSVRIFVALLLAFSIVLLSGCAVNTLSRRAPTATDTSEGVSFLQSLEQEDAAANENSIRAGREEQSTTASALQTTNALQSGNFKAAFRDIIIAGDSLIQALTEYHLLSTDQAIGEVGANTGHLEKITGTLVAKNPKALVLHYGENALDKQERAPYFIRNYKACIQTLQNRLPNTKIYVDSIFPVQEKAHKTEPYTVNIDYYNRLIEAMAKELGVTFLDYDPLFQSFSENYYDPDGIHPKYKFYKDQYLPFVYSEVYRN